MHSAEIIQVITALPTALPFDAEFDPDLVVLGLEKTVSTVDTVASLKSAGHYVGPKLPLCRKPIRRRPSEIRRNLRYRFHESSYAVTT